MLLLKLSISIIAALSLVPGVTCYSTGADDTPAVCTTLIPGHGSTSKPLPSSYTIAFTPATFTAGGAPISVTISGATFKGFLLTTQYADSNVDQTLIPGTFQAVNGTKLICNNGAVTHTSGVDKNTLTFQWSPPTTSLAHIRFRATFVKTKLEFWVDVQPTNWLYDSARSTPVFTPTTTPAANGPTGSIIKDPACGKTKGCFSDCSGSSCSYLMMWEPVSGNASVVRITMKGKVGSDTSRYIAFGLSTDQKMGSDSVNYCIGEQNAGSVFAAWNVDGSKNNILLADAKSGISNTAVALSNGILTCTFTRLKAANTTGQRFALDPTYSILWAAGPGGSKFGVSRHDTTIVSTQTAALTDFTVDISGGVDNPLIKAHGSLMLIAWVFAASIGIVFARYFKNVWEDKKLFDQKIWFQVHRTSMVIVLLATVIAFIIIFVEVDGYSEISGEGYKKAHPILGIIVTALTVINPIMAMFRCHPGTKNRPIFNWAHWGVGTGAYILGIITIFFGLSLDESGAPEYAIYVMAAFVAWQGCLQIVLEILQFVANHSGHSNEYELSNMANSEKASEQKPSTFYKVVLGAVHVLVVTAFVIALIVILNVG